MKITNNAELREMLLNTIEDVKAGKTDYKQAKSIVEISREILHSAKIDLEVLRYRAVNKDTEQVGDKVLQLVNISKPK